jgi:SAM-dependent methyltransferase
LSRDAIDPARTRGAMDRRPPYEDGAERRRLLYRMMMPPTAARALCIGGGSATELLGTPRLADGMAWRPQAWSEGWAQDLAPTSFDFIALQAADPVLETGATGPMRGPAAVLAELALLLRPGGVLVGDLPNAHALRVLFAPGRRAASALSVSACARLLVAAGLEAVECYFVEPHIAAPRALVPSAPAAARAHFLRALRRTRDNYSPLGYAARVAATALGAGGTMQPHLFFRARRPC